MKETISAAIMNQKQAYDKYVEEVFQVVEEKMIFSSKIGMTSALITVDDFIEHRSSKLKVLFKSNTERFINDLAEYLEIDKDLIKRVYAPNHHTDNQITGMFINWGESDVK